ncbi:TfdA family Taurine catabolism dioxygenase TauD [Colletotrichum salicis]|uniref:TfdA family Taurine catabolism dioxygenase TauD n=1 Tax=Colletotrichum salicis TaxID=1209931 RepID=A0A135SXI4_9PEZI|nr:TfdA family Taurine catabolism dioxygenase TauD [Colletotrichum salicis]
MSELAGVNGQRRSVRSPRLREEKPGRASAGSSRHPAGALSESCGARAVLGYAMTLCLLFRLFAVRPAKILTSDGDIPLEMMPTRKCQRGTSPGQIQGITRIAAAAVQAPFHAGPPGQPDIGYAPNHDSFVARTKLRQELETLEKSLPVGFPQKLESKLVWDGNTLAEHYDWNYILTDADKKEVDDALGYFKSLRQSLGDINQETFPLPHLHETLREISHEIHNGHGFKVILGAPVTKYTREGNIIIYAGVCSHVASIRGRQDNQFRGEPADVVLAHIKDVTKIVDPHKIGAPAYTTEKQVFHTDLGDAIALLALGEAAEGGQSYLSTSWHFYNELAMTRPDLIRTLAEP